MVLENQRRLVEAVNTTDLMKLAATCYDNLSMSDVDVAEHPCDQRVLPILEAIGKTVIHPALDPRKNDFTTANAFWLILRRDGEPFGCVGAKFDDLGAETMSEYLSRTNRRHYPESPANYDHLDPSLVEHVRGRVSYMGDLYFSKDSRGTEWCTQVLRNLLLLHHLTIQAKWSVDCTYAFLRRKDVWNAKVEEYHFMEGMPDYQRWQDPPAGRSQTEYLLTMRRSAFSHLVSYLNAHPEDLAWRQQ